MACDDGKCPEFTVNAVLKRVKVGKISRTLQTRLAFAQFKVEHGLEDLPFDTIEPRVKELQDANDRSSNSSSSSSDILSSPYEGDNHRYINQRCYVESFGKGSAAFSDQLQLMNIIRGSPSHRKRHCNRILEDCNNKVYSWKRHCSSPLISHITPTQGRNQALSSPVMSRKHHHFRTDSGPSLPLFADACRKSFMYNRCITEVYKEDDELPPNPSDFRSSPPPPPPCTPPPRHCNDKIKWRRIQNVEKRGKEDVNEVHSLLKHHHHHLPTSPLLRKTPAPLRHPPSTPPARSPILPSSVISTMRETYDIFSSDTDPHTPLQAFDFSDFVNITPSPSRPPWAVTPQTVPKSKSVNY